jgi:hypothetical protein
MEAPSQSNAMPRIPPAWRVFAARARAATCLAVALCTVLSPARQLRAETLVDLELVFAVDASGSVDDDEYALQIGGIAAAFRDPAVTAAISSGARGSIAVAVLVWSEATRPKDASDWWIVRSAADAEAFASHLESRPRLVGGGTTGIESGIAAAVTMIASNTIVGQRSTVDVSGDGIENSAGPVHSSFAKTVRHLREIAEARVMARRLNITVNGLAILTEVPDLDRWYEAHVKSGPGSFVMAVETYTDFASAMLEKLLREIGAGPTISQLPATTNGPVPM